MMDERDLARFGLKITTSWNDDTQYVIVPTDGVQVFERGDDRLLVVIIDDFHVYWTLMGWTSVSAGEITHAVVCHGSGPCGNLREPRHTWFSDAGEDGYVFYIRPALLTWAFGILSKWFDYDGEKEGG